MKSGMCMFLMILKFMLQIKTKKKHSLILCKSNAFIAYPML